MTLTRLYLDTSVVDYLGPWLTQVGLSTATDGTNATIAGRVAEAMEAFGLSVADPSNVTDEELAAVPAGQEKRFRLHVLLWTAQLVQARLGGQGVTVSYSAGNRSRTFRDQGGDLQALIRMIGEWLAKEGGLVTSVGGAAWGRMRAGLDLGAGGLRDVHCWPRTLGYLERLP